MLDLFERTVNEALFDSQRSAVGPLRGVPGATITASAARIGVGSNGTNPNLMPVSKPSFLLSRRKSGSPARMKRLSSGDGGGNQLMRGLALCVGGFLEG
jgi:hypothetical protein